MSTPQAVRKAAGIGPETILQKIVHPAIAQLYLGNVVVTGKFEPHRAAGFVTRGQDFPQGTSEQFAEAFGVDRVADWPRGTQYLLRFLAHTTELFDTSFGGPTLEGARKMGTSRVYPVPFTGTGYTPSANPIPEYVMELAELPAGTELWRFEPDGTGRSVGKYLNRQVGWIPTGDVGFGPARFWQAPVPHRPTVRRGLIGRYRGQDFDVDFGPAPGSVLLHPLAGQPAPPDFTVEHGAAFLEVPDALVEDLQLVRTVCTYRGAEFEIVGVLGDQAVLHFLGENYEVAQELGLSEVDFRQWRTVARRDEVSDIRGDARPVQRGLFAREN
ncbi:hypothetical protein V1227_30500 [Lentzea sp. DG1S-22]|uniref:hypothetical protein n=1 Tax=unclassified Lentzea TaxID=2643253 RepID=UPI001F39ED65|nr:MULTISPECIES: hypothetical protein [unclassified Lentzea]MCG8921599.1 hypothetical protein [Lentzea sp. CC55]WVH79337.1 hypothetical protein V1227_30500 [Lentzea sp. DG1S-22]